MHGNNLQREHDTGGTPAKCKIKIGNEKLSQTDKNAANKLSYNREEKTMHGNNLQREHDTGGTPAAANIFCDKLAKFSFV